MLVAGIHSDLRVRRILRARLQEDADEERGAMVDRHQRELFSPGWFRGLGPRTGCVA